ncbi:MAG: hypothetical protein KGJ62_05230 [Armatimonadetes bacterium]|nr:hypothetical protein [Armatimonadota bacterium]MDE2207109.1 hypothetical protein [Armatimonadota bacterium]
MPRHRGEDLTLSNIDQGRLGPLAQHEFPLLVRTPRRGASQFGVQLCESGDKPIDAP